MRFLPLWSTRVSKQVCACVCMFVYMCVCTCV